MVHAPFPGDLVAAQQSWNRTYAALAASRPQHATALRRDLLRLSTAINAHPFWSSTPGGPPAARVELRRRVRSQRTGQPT
nr:hypothetical protein [Streptomyces rimosus]